MLRPEGLAVGQLHLILQPKAVALRAGGGGGGESTQTERWEAGEAKSTISYFISGSFLFDP